MTVLKKKFSAVAGEWVTALNVAYNAVNRKELLKWIFRKLDGGKWEDGLNWSGSG